MIDPRATLLALALLAACQPPDAGRVDERTAHPDAAPIAPFPECTVYTAREPTTSQAHTDLCASIERPFHPPAQGAHYSAWADYREYDAPVPWGFLVHALEHGGVVLAYRCEAPCPEITDALRAAIDAHGPDPLCRGGDLPARFVMVPDPELEWPIAAVAWEHVYLATCVDPDSLGAFVEEHYARGPEDTCAPGLDLSATGWCP